MGFLKSAARAARDINTIYSAAQNLQKVAALAKKMGLEVSTRRALGTGDGRYKVVAKLLKRGLSVEEVADITSLDVATVRTVNQSETKVIEAELVYD